MEDERAALARPVGWWLKEADARITEAFTQAFGSAGLDRRRWQLLTTLSDGASERGALADALRRFDDRAEIDAVLDDLVDQGLVTTDETARLTLTDRGAEIQRQVAVQVDAVRQRVVAALGEDGYRRLVTLLARLVDELGNADG